jgi:glutamyl-tRNA synthetase
MNTQSTPTTGASVRVRMAPSPTGFFHVGSARTALFNYLFARHFGGTFVLRIEDTDAARGSAEYEQVIYDAMAWLGLDADEGPQSSGDFGPYRQSERFEIYRNFADQLIENGAAYRAYETSEELAAMKADQAARKLPPRYNGAHRDLTEAQRAAFEAEGRPSVVRFRVPDEKEIGWRDLVHGDTKWQSKEIDDFVIQKSDGSPTYNFACAVDDALMKISHVIRGEDGLSNTPRQILIYNALGFEVPHFAHLPFLLGPDRKKLSKRHGAVNLLEFAAQGILPQAMFNYLALLGWNPGEGETQEVFSREELIQRFSLDGVNKSGAIFDPEKLAWMNTQYIKALPYEEFYEMAAPQLSDVKSEMSAEPEYSRRALLLARERMGTFATTEDLGQGEKTTRIETDLASGAKYFFSDDFSFDEKGLQKHGTPEAKSLLRELNARFSALPDWNHDAIEGAIRALAEEKNVKPAAFIHPARIAVSGRSVGPSLFELLEVLGRERVLRRLEKFSRASS